VKITISDLRAGYRPTIADKIASVDCIDELTGFYNQMRIDGRLDEETRRLIATRKAQIQKEK